MIDSQVIEQLKVKNNIYIDGKFYDVGFNGEVFSSTKVFENKNLGNIYFKNCTFYDVSFDKCIGEYFFCTCELYRCTFIDAHIACSIFDRCTLISSIFDNCYMNNAILSQCRIYSCKFNSANLCKTTINYCVIANSEFIKTKMKNTALRHNSYENSILPKARNICPKNGKFIAWKRAGTKDKTHVIVKLEIPEDAKRISTFSNRCRCDKAKVLEIQDLFGNVLPDTTAISLFSNHFIIHYKPGNIVYANGFNPDYREDCSYGINFFMTKKEALDY